MLKKTFTLLTCLFFIQLLVSCYDDCNCPKRQDREATFKALSTKTEFVFTLQDSVVHLVNFYIFLELTGAEVETSLNSFNLDGLGFSKANACDCVPPMYIFNNGVDSVNIILKASGSEVSNITDWFFYSNGDYSKPINEYFQQLETPFINDALYLEMPLKLDSSKLSSLPEKFELEVNLFHQGTKTLSDTLIVDLKNTKLNN